MMILDCSDALHCVYLTYLTLIALNCECNLVIIGKHLSGSVYLELTRTRTLKLVALMIKRLLLLLISDIDFDL